MKFSFDLHVALQAAAVGAHVIRKHSAKPFTFRLKGVRDIVTEVDEKTQVAVVKALKKFFPNDQVLAEEGDFSKTGEAARRWVLDPIDGTTNFAHGYPCYCLSLALQEKGIITAGVVFDPTRDEIFFAEHGKGAFSVQGKALAAKGIISNDGSIVTKARDIKALRKSSNKKPPLIKLPSKRLTSLRVSKAKTLQEALLVSGFTYDFQRPGFDNSPYFMHFQRTALAVRRDGSAALDMAYVAAGRFDGFWELGLKLWDYAAGLLLVREAGGLVTGLDGKHLGLGAHAVIAANPAIAQKIVKDIEAVRSSQAHKS